MPKASDIKKFAAIELNGKVSLVKEITKLTPSGRAGASLYRMRIYDVATGSKSDVSFKADEMITLADFSRQKASFSYIDGEEYVFMDDEDYTPYTFTKDAISEELLFITEDTKGIEVLTVDGVPVALELPATVELTIVETDPSIKGASASARTKPATLSTGLVVQVPEYIANGEKIKINTAEHKFMSRADK
ncbi:elongation factor P-like protein EfpL [Photobacterium phosphoreum]|uniref:Elongation factor P-like protein n=1 Tax=Photobacterium phosphoreum TaxID=659 RepID=A0A2T3JQ43_PHOPO|nr:elongation factor P-like protein YeiP [Photobacterium phosphoreum]KJF86954.1 elongation factor P [Photobacterium phosphoreum]MCD9464924.1 elongation factor P-like protein YeiP [Photobacterium phosphoreum]MCD9471011.1 elongation factor P-like protein YeiP [Photobacterium phosphoreum]MCD9476516.1 elongation factor P-like protein YeiP [Photobacterium phosphoreum]MCD9480363.1 elongation factor P-like protein YeiP [Photobacterium phosphoreum]